MKTLAGIIEAGEPLIQQAIEAHRRYREAQDSGAPPKELARLLLEAEWLFQAITDYQLRALGGPASSLH